MIFGWITPSRVFVPTQAYLHIEAVCKNEVLQSLLPDGLKDPETELEYVRRGCEESVEAGEHPEWHRYEMALDRFGSDVIKALYESGAVRVGEAPNKILCFEGTPQGLANLHQFCKDFAEDLGMTPKLEPRTIR